MAQDTEQCTKFQRGSTGQKGHNNKFSHDSEARGAQQRIRNEYKK